MTPSTPDADLDSHVVGLGVAIRRVRKRRGLTLATLADATGLSASFLSQVESGRSDIAFGRLRRIAAALDVHVSDFTDVPRISELHVVRAEERQNMSAEEGVILSPLAAGADGVQNYYWIEVEVGRTNGGTAFPGEYVLVVLQGRMQWDLGRDTLSMNAGDSVTFRTQANMQATITARSDEKNDEKLICLLISNADEANGGFAVDHPRAD